MLSYEESPRFLKVESLEFKGRSLEVHLDSDRSQVG